MLVINVEAVTYIDATAVDALKALRDELGPQGTVLALARAAVAAYDAATR